MTTATLESEISEKAKYLNDLLQEKIDRPATKGEYLTLVEQTQQEIADLISRNDTIIDENAQEVINAQLAFESTDEYKWAQIRSKRALLLFESDWTQLSDVPLSNDEKVAWQIYRQELRDITKQVDLTNIIWPSIPES